MYRIHLNDIPPEGREFRYTPKSGELNNDLNDVLGANNYDIQFTLKPLGGAYEIRGQLKAKGELTCSTCGWDLPWPVQKDFHEFLIEEAREDKYQTHAHGSESLDLSRDEDGYAFYKGNHFDVGAYFHELLALAEPAYPKCGITDCEHRKAAEAKLNEIHKQADGFEEQKSPFSVLKSLYLGSNRGSN